jgi:peptide maturation system protein (TIGR04066 family)
MEEDYDKIDAVWLCDSTENITDENLLKNVDEILGHDKQLMITRHVNKEVSDKITELVKKRSATAIPCDNTAEIINLNENSGFLDYIMTPIVSVAGAGESTDKFLTELLLKEYLEKNDYKVILISSRNNCRLLKGVYPFPDFMNYNISTEHKIIRYNRFVKKLEKEYNPDIIIVGIPGGVLPSSSINARNFELHPYAVFNAVKPLYSVVCLYGNHVSSDYLHELRQTMKYKYGTDVDFFYRSSTTPDLDMVLEKGSRTLEALEAMYANLDESAYIYDEIPKIGDIIMKKIRKTY